MNCSPSPEVTCGTILSDACVVVTSPWLSCYPGTNSCPRLSEWIEATGNKVCAIDAAVTTINNGIDLSTLTGCDSITPVKETVAEEFQNVYDNLCDLKASLTNWADLPLPEGFNTGCLGDPCCTTAPTTLGELLEALVSKVCCITSNGIINTNGDLISTVCPDCPNP